MTQLQQVSPVGRLESELKALLQPHVGNLRYKDMLSATRQAFYDITEELRDMGLTWAQVTELTGAPRTTITSIPYETPNPIPFKNRFMTELRRRSGMQMSRSDAGRLYFQLRDEEDDAADENEENRRSGLDNFLKALKSMGLVELLNDRRRSIRAVSRSDSTVSAKPARSVMGSIRHYANRVVDLVVSRTAKRPARMYRTHFDILPEDIGDFLDEWKEQTIQLVRRYEAKALEETPQGSSAGVEQVAIVYGGASVDEISAANSSADALAQ